MKKELTNFVITLQTNKIAKNLKCNYNYCSIGELPKFHFKR